MPAGLHNVIKTYEKLSQLLSSKVAIPVHCSGTIPHADWQPRCTEVVHIEPAKVLPLHTQQQITQVQATGPARRVQYLPWDVQCRVLCKDAVVGQKVTVPGTQRYFGVSVGERKPDRNDYM